MFFGRKVLLIKFAGVIRQFCIPGRIQLLSLDNYARQISGVEQVLAVLGGFHLARATDDEIRLTIAELKSLNPALVSPAHCTGFKATAALAAQLPGAFVLASVGTTYLF